MSPDSFVIGGLSYDPGSGLAESSRGFFFRLCAGRRDNFFSNSSACRSALSALVRFFDMPTVSHRTDDLATTVDFKLHHYRWVHIVAKRENGRYNTERQSSWVRVKNPAYTEI